jgi:hypothetical protein
MDPRLRRVLPTPHSGGPRLWKHYGGGKIPARRNGLAQQRFHIAYYRLFVLAYSVFIVFYCNHSVFVLS